MTVILDKPHRKNGPSVYEREIRSAVVQKFRDMRPNGRVVHELNSAGTGSIRFDVACVSRAEILICEIKSKLDKLDRLEHQIPAMDLCGHRTIVAFDEKFLDERKSNPDAMTHEREGEPHIWAVPDMIGRKATSWVYPERQRGGRYSKWHWQMPDPAIQKPLSGSALHMLWRDELLELCRTFKIATGKRPNRSILIAAILWGCSGEQITKGICWTLRKRVFAEADAPLDEELKI
ncbi:NERD domain-containing protein [Lentilitoribacter sp. EG35]|uniref:NERD domain-containing protein n=1 Tax=Lentilitoribacter sp. EG35 TaxID=3234192 RepID=UPI00345FC4A5